MINIAQALFVNYIAPTDSWSLLKVRSQQPVPCASTPAGDPSPTPPLPACPDPSRLRLGLRIRVEVIHIRIYYYLS